MKSTVVLILVSLAFVSQAFAVLRPLFPAKPAAPFNGEIIIIGDEFVLGSAKKTPAACPMPGQKLWLLSRGSPFAGERFGKGPASPGLFST